MKIEELKKRKWWGYLEPDLQGLFQTAFYLIRTIKSVKEDGKSSDQKFHDYSFVVFPASKAYEGFLKKFFLDLGFIGQDDYFGKRFRVGKALNPALGKKYRKESVYVKLANYCGGVELADRLWDTWKTCRNLLFHWFPKEKKAISFEDSIKCVIKITSSIDAAFRECDVKGTSK